MPGPSRPAKIAAWVINTHRNAIAPMVRFSVGSLPIEMMWLMFE